MDESSNQIEIESPGTHTLSNSLVYKLYQIMCPFATNETKKIEKTKNEK